MNFIEFNDGDVFFEPVLAFYASWIGFSCFVYGKRPEVVDGRLRGIIIPQIIFEDDTIAGKLARQEPVTTLKFKLSSETPPPEQGYRISTARLMEFWCQQMIGHAYEIALDRIEQKFGKQREKRKDNWPSEFQFFYHVRNGCFHGNKFDLRGSSISTTIKTVWRGKEIQYSDNGAKVAGLFMLPADFICLLYDIQQALN